MDRLKRYLLEPPTGHAVLLDGAWGSGKSFQWNRFSQSPEMSAFEPITISVAGLISEEQLESALFQASLEDLGSGVVREAATVIGRALLRVVKVEPDDIKLKASFMPGKTVVCLDDVERFAGDFAVLFGFVLNLLDRGRIHCILIADESQAIEKFGTQFGTYKERIVGRTIPIKSDILSFCKEAVQGVADQTTRELLLAQTSYINHLIHVGDVSNLRTIRHFINETAALITEIRPIEGSDLKPLLSAMFFWITASNRDASARSTAAAVFRIGGMDLSVQIHVNRKSTTKLPETTQDFAQLLILECGLENEAASWPKSSEFASMICGSAISAATLAQDFDLHVTRQSHSPARATQGILGGYIMMTDIELQTRILEARRIIREGTDGDLVELIELYRTLNYFRDVGLISLSKEEFNREMTTAFSSYDADQITCDAASFEFMADNQGIRNTPIWDATCALAKKIEDRESKKRQEDKVNQIFDPSSEIPDLVSSERTFTNVQPADLAARLIAAAPIATERLGRAARAACRVSNARSFLQNEVQFYDALVSELKNQLHVDSPATIAQVSVSRTVDQLILLAEHVR